LRRRHRAVRQQHTCHAFPRKVMHDMAHPSKVGVAAGPRPILPPDILAQPVAAPIGNVKGGFASTKSALRSRSSSLWKLPSLFHLMSASMPRTARFILHNRQVV
jgi:hypothetical protein